MDADVDKRSRFGTEYRLQVTGQGYAPTASGALGTNSTGLTGYRFPLSTAPATVRRHRGRDLESVTSSERFRRGDFGRGVDIGISIDHYMLDYNTRLLHDNSSLPIDL